MRKIAIRIDDVTPEMDWQAFARFADLLDRYEIRPLIGVVPMNRDPQLIASPSKRNPEWKERSDFAAWLKEKEQAGWTIALHGHSHKYTTKSGGIFPLNHYSEYAGLPADTQTKMLKEGRARLAEWGINTEIFMAPAHSFDRGTLQALKESGFRYVTDGFGARPYLKKGLVFLPISFLKSKTMKAENGYSTLVVHTWDQDAEELAWYERLFSTQRERFIDYRELLREEAKKRSVIGDLTEYLMAAGKRLAADLKRGGSV